VIPARSRLADPRWGLHLVRVITADPHIPPKAAVESPYRKTLPAGVVLLALLLARPASAQTADWLPRSKQLSASARAMALGDAYPMDSGHADALFVHPALLTNAAGMGLEIQRWGPASTAAALSASFAWLGGRVGLGLRSLQFGLTDGADPAVPAGEDHLFQPGDVQASERVATVGYGREAWFDFDVGVAVDLVEERVGQSRESVVQLDVGLARELGPLTLGLTVADLGERPVIGSGSGPSRVSLGAGAYGWEVWALDLGFAATVGWEVDEVVYGGGLEIGYWPIQGRTFVARVGLQDVPEGSDASPLTTGFAFWGDDLVLEWAFRPVRGADEGGTHRFSVRWR